MKIALGQYEIYKDFLEEIDPKRQLYLAVSSETDNEVFQQKTNQFIIKRHQLPFIIVNIETEDFDEEHDQYLWLQVGWLHSHRVHSITLHLRLHDGKIWIEQDWTENGIATELLKAGVSNDEIVLGFRHPKKRPLTEFAVA